MLSKFSKNNKIVNKLASIYPFIPMAHFRNKVRALVMAPENSESDKFRVKISEILENAPAQLFWIANCKQNLTPKIRGKVFQPSPYPTRLGRGEHRLIF